MKRTVIILTTLAAVVACGDVSDALDDMTREAEAQPTPAPVTDVYDFECGTETELVRTGIYFNPAASYAVESDWKPDTIWATGRTRRENDTQRDTATGELLVYCNVNTYRVRLEVTR